MWALMFVCKIISPKKVWLCSELDPCTPCYCTSCLQGCMQKTTYIASEGMYMYMHVLIQIHTLIIKLQYNYALTPTGTWICSFHMCTQVQVNSDCQNVQSLNTHTHSHVQTYKHMYTGTHILPQLIHCSCIRQSYWPEARTVCLPFLLPIGPTPTTISDFWQMIWDHKPAVIVMLTKFQENGKVSTCAMHRKTPPTLHSSSVYSITLL